MTYRHYYDRGDTTINADRILQENNPNDEHEMIATVYLTEENFRLLLNSAFFRAALEQCLKDYVNISPDCIDRSINKDDLDLVKYTSFALDLVPQLLTNIEEKKDVNNTSCILLGSNWGNLEDITCYVELKTKCHGRSEACKKKFNERFLDNNIVLGKINKTGSQESSCDQSFNDLLQEKMTFLPVFDYDVLESSFSFQFDFQQSGDRLSGAEIKAENNNTLSKDIPCLNQCQAQHQALQDIFSDFGKDFFYDGNHECDHKGINCNQENLVTSIWLGEYCQSIFLLAL